LSKNNVSERLKDTFKTEGFSLSKEVTVTKIKDGKWMIIDDEKGEIYSVIKDDKNLNIEPICDTCKLFGSTTTASKVKIPDLYVSEPWAGVFEKRDGVGIDRDTETAAEGAKFDYEVVPSQTEFDFEMICENLNARYKLLLAIGVKEMQSGVASLGGNRSRGLGAFRLIIDKISLLDFEDRESISAYLKEHKVKPVEPAEFIKEAIKPFLKGGEHNA